MKESSQRLGESPGTLSSRMQSVLHEKDTATREAVHTRLLMQNAETESTELKHEVLNLRSKIDSRDTEIGNLQRAVAEYRAQLQRLQDEKVWLLAVILCTLVSREGLFFAISFL